MRKLIFILTMIYAKLVFGIEIESINNYFTNTDGCFILYDLDNHKQVYEYNHSRCQKRIPPNSTFKIPLSLMAYDQGIINDNTVFKWDGESRDFTMWNHDQTPKSWLTYSVVWVSRVITPQLGMSKIKQYLAKFDYGNQVFNGKNALSRGWISGNLQISGIEQLNFLINLYDHKLPIKVDAMTSTYQNMFLESFDNHWQLYGKTGSGYNNRNKSLPKNTYIDGWFVGFITKNNKHYVFVTNISDIKPTISVNLAGITAKNITKQILLQMIQNHSLD